MDKVENSAGMRERERMSEERGRGGGKECEKKERPKECEKLRG